MQSRARFDFEITIPSQVGCCRTVTLKRRADPATDENKSAGRRSAAPRAAAGQCQRQVLLPRHQARRPIAASWSKSGHAIRAQEGRIGSVQVTYLAELVLGYAARVANITQCQAKRTGNVLGRIQSLGSHCYDAAREMPMSNIMKHPPRRAAA